MKSKGSTTVAVEKQVRPYFADENERPPVTSGDVPNVMFVDFLARLEGPAKINIDPRQEMLVMLLRARCLRYALAPEAEDIIRTVNQLCALYQAAAFRAGLKTFEVFQVFLSEYVASQEQVFLTRKQADDEEQRPTGRTNNLLNHCHELLENFLRKLSTLGMFSLDVVSGSPDAVRLTPQQYLDLEVKKKARRFEEDPKILTQTFTRLFGSARHDIRNSIAHRRYEIHEDGSVTLYDFHPQRLTRTNLGRFGQADLESMIKELEIAVDIFEISLLIFQHNHGSILYELGYYRGSENLSDEKITQMIHLEAPAAFLRVKEVAFTDEYLRIAVQVMLPEFAMGNEPSTVHVHSKDKNGRPLNYSLEIPPKVLSARDQTLRLMQKAAIYSKRRPFIQIRTEDQNGNVIGEVHASRDWIEQARAEGLSIDRFLERVAKNTFPAA